MRAVRQATASGRKNDGAAGWRFLCRQTHLQGLPVYCRHPSSPRWADSGPPVGQRPQGNWAARWPLLPRSTSAQECTSALLPPRRTTADPPCHRSDATSCLAAQRTSVPQVQFVAVAIPGGHPDNAAATPPVASGDPPSRPFAVAVKLQNETFER